MSTSPKPRKPRGINANPLTTKEKIRMVYRRMVQSCIDTNHPSYKNYGAKGVYVNTTDWPNSLAFYEWAITSGYQPGLSIDRIDNDGPYAIANVRWADRKTQQRNRISNQRHDYYGVDLTAGEILDLHQVKYNHAEHQRLVFRLKAGWGLEEAISKPSRSRKANSDPKTRVQYGQTARYTYQGRSYAAKKLLELVWGGIITHSELNRFLNRIYRGWTLEEALVTPKH